MGWQTGLPHPPSTPYVLAAGGWLLVCGRGGVAPLPLWWEPLLALHGIQGAWERGLEAWEGAGLMVGGAPAWQQCAPACSLISRRCRGAQFGGYREFQGEPTYC